MREDKQLADFVGGALRRQGALVERRSGGLDVVLPDEVQTRLELPEMVRFSWRSGGGEGVPLDYDSPVLEDVASLLDDAGRFAASSCGGRPPKRARLAREAREALPASNAAVRLQGIESGEGSYLIGHFAAVMTADHRREELLAVALAEGHPAAAPGLPAAWEAAAAPGEMLEAGRRHEPGPPPDPRAYRFLAALARRAAGRVLAPSIRGLERRLARDLRRLEEYYGALLEQAGSPRSRGKKKEDAAARRRAVQSEWRRKAGEAAVRYSPTLRVEPVAVLRLRLPVWAARYRLLRRKREREVALGWNALTRCFDLPVCEACGAEANPVTVCDGEGAHLLCGECAASRRVASRDCPACKKGVGNPY